MYRDEQRKREVAKEVTGAPSAPLTNLTPHTSESVRVVPRTRLPGGHSGVTPAVSAARVPSPAASQQQQLNTVDVASSRPPSSMDRRSLERRSVPTGSEK